MGHVGVEKERETASQLYGVTPERLQSLVLGREWDRLVLGLLAVLIRGVAKALPGVEEEVSTEERL